MNNYIVRVTSDEQFHTVRKFIGKDLLEGSHSEFNPFDVHSDLDQYFIGYYLDGFTYYNDKLLEDCGEVISYGEWCDRFYSPSLVSAKKDVVPFPRVMEVRDREDEEWYVGVVYCLDGGRGAYCDVGNDSITEGIGGVTIHHYKYVRKCVVVEVSVEEIAKWKNVSVDQVKVVGL